MPSLPHKVSVAQGAQMLVGMGVSDRPPSTYPSFEHLKFKATYIKVGDMEFAIISKNSIRTAVDVVNVDHKIATLSPDADVEMEVTVDTGKGYVPAEKNKTEDMPIGTIPIDSVFSPVQRVNYLVSPALVGR